MVLDAPPVAPFAEEVAPDEPLRLPSPPTEGPAPSFAWISALAPIAGALVLWLVTRSPSALWFAALGPVLAVATLLDGRRGMRRRRRREKREVAARVAAVRAAIVERHDGERNARWSRHPDVARHLAHPEESWRSVPGRAEHVVVGSGVGRSALRVDGGDDSPSSSAVRQEAAVIEAVPVTVPLTAGIAVIGPRVIADAVARALVLQVCLAVPPQSLRVTGDVDDWDAGLPHREATAPAELHIARPGAAVPTAVGAHRRRRCGEPSSAALCGGAHARVAHPGAARSRRAHPHAARGGDRPGAGGGDREGARPAGVGAAGSGRRSAPAARGAPARRAAARLRRAARRDRRVCGRTRDGRPRARRTARGRHRDHRVGQERAAHHVGRLARDGPHTAGGRVPARRLQGRARLRRAAGAAACHGRRHRPRRADHAPRDPEPPRGDPPSRDGDGGGRCPRHRGGGRRAGAPRGGRRRVCRAGGRASGAARPVRRPRRPRSRAGHPPDLGLPASLGGLPRRGPGQRAAAAGAAGRRSGRLADRARSRRCRRTVGPPRRPGALPRPWCRRRRAPPGARGPRDPRGDRTAHRWRGRERAPALAAAAPRAHRPRTPPIRPAGLARHRSGRRAGSPAAGAGRARRRRSGSPRARRGRHRALDGAARARRAGRRRHRRTRAGGGRLGRRRAGRALPARGARDRRRPRSAARPSHPRACDGRPRRLERLAREARARGIRLAASAQRAGGALARVADALPRRLLLAHASRGDLVAAGGEAADFGRLPPGRGHLDGILVQCAWTPPGAALPADADLPPWYPGRHPVALVIPGGPRCRAVVEHWRAAGVDVQPVDTPASAGWAAGTVRVGTPEAWLGQWRLLAAARAEAQLVVDAACAAEYRAVTGSAELPPYAVPGEGRAWLHAPGGAVTRIALPR